MSLQARFSNLDGSSLPVQEGWQAQTCSWAAVGGPDEAILALEDPTPAALTSAGSLIGAGLELWDTARSLPAWWGRVTGLELQCGGLVQSLDLEGAANRVAVRESRWPRPTTPHASDSST